MVELGSWATLRVLFQKIMNHSWTSSHIFMSSPLGKHIISQVKMIIPEYIVFSVLPGQGEYGFSKMHACYQVLMKFMHHIHY